MIPEFLYISVISTPVKMGEMSCPYSGIVEGVEIASCSWDMTHALLCLGLFEQENIGGNQPVSQFAEEDRRLLLQRARPTETGGRELLRILKDLLRIVEYLKL